MGLLSEPPEEGSGQDHRNGDKPKGGFHLAGEVSGNPETKGTDGVAKVTPKAIDADG